MPTIEAMIDSVCSTLSSMPKHPPSIARSALTEGCGAGMLAYVNQSWREHLLSTGVREQWLVPLEGPRASSGQEIASVTVFRPDQRVADNLQAFLRDAGLPVDVTVTPASAPLARDRATGAPRRPHMTDPGTAELVLGWVGSGVVGPAAWALTQALVKKWRRGRGGVADFQPPVSERELAVALARWRLVQEFGEDAPSWVSKEEQRPDGGWTIEFKDGPVVMEAVLPPGEEKILDSIRVSRMQQDE